MSKVNRNYKSGVFTHLFGEPEKELELYNALDTFPEKAAYRLSDSFAQASENGNAKEKIFLRSALQIN